MPPKSISDRIGPTIQAELKKVLRGMRADIQRKWETAVASQESSYTASYTRTGAMRKALDVTATIESIKVDIDPMGSVEVSGAFILNAATVLREHLSKQQAADNDPDLVSKIRHKGFYAKGRYVGSFRDQKKSYLADYLAAGPNIRSQANAIVYWKLGGSEYSERAGLAHNLFETFNKLMGFGGYLDLAPSTIYGGNVHFSGGKDSIIAKALDQALINLGLKDRS